MKTLDISLPIRQALANAEGIEEISDAFCFTVGFISSELKERLSKSPEESDKESLKLQLESIEAAWTAYKLCLGRVE